MIKVFLYFVLSLSFVFPLSGMAQNQNRPIPAGMFPYEFANSGFNGQDHFLFTGVKVGIPPASPNFVYPYAMIFDGDGYLSWFWQLSVTGCSDFKYHPSIDKYTVSTANNGIVKFMVLDNQLNVIDTLIPQNVAGDIHDLELAANGNWLLATAPQDTVDLSAYTFNGQQGGVATPIVGFGVQEFDPSGTLVFEWNSNEYINPADFFDFYTYNPNDFDYCHGNAIEEDDDGNVLISFRHLNAIYKVNRTTGAVMWVLGGVSSDFTFTNDGGFSGQHDIRRLPNGNYSLFDNSNMGTVPKKSRGVEYQLDTVNWTATRVKEVLHPDENYHRAMGSYTSYPNGESMLGWGFSYRPDPNVSYFDAANNVLAEYFFSDSIMTYRAKYQALPGFERPEISCSNGNVVVTLTAPNAASYLWSTGETTQSISVWQTGTFQVWIPMGQGYVGSYPFEVTNLIMPCGSALEEEGVMHEDSFNYFDLYGRKVEEIKFGNVYLKVYSNGSVERIAHTD
jgi:hypothetical protein